jgi:demethylmenaquinone methyltransferase/2-methoxy-6-polyprenyl-1,4-benzoquinol methylase
LGLRDIGIQIDTYQDARQFPPVGRVADLKDLVSMNKIDDTRKLIEEMNRYYEARAPWHDQYMGYKSNESLEELMRPMIEAVEKMIIGKRTLEVACGTGNWTEVLAKRAATVVAIDISPAVLAIALSKLSDYKNVAIMQGDAYDLGKINDSFEVLFSADWWSHIPKAILPLFLSAAIKKLLPGSIAIFVDMSFREEFKQEPCHYDKDNNRISLRKLPDGLEFQVVKNFPSESELRQFLADYGKIIDYYEFSALKRWMVVLKTDNPPNGHYT